MKKKYNKKKKKNGIGIHENKKWGGVDSLIGCAYSNNMPRTARRDINWPRHTLLRHMQMKKKEKSQVELDNGQGGVGFLMEGDRQR
jgi:hypothetical protein